MDIVYRHGCTLRYEFNAKKSGVLVYGEDRKEHKHNVQHRAFRLGPAKVSERENYDHVGIRAIISDDDVSGIEERLSKARRTFNAVSGIGIRSNGLTMATCNVIFWTIVVPAALYGSEIWIMNAKAIAIIEAFQIYACKRIQRLYSRVPNAPALYALGWMRLERYIQVKKMLFIRSIMTLDDQTLSRKVFCERATILYRRPGFRDFDNSHSVVFDLLEVASTFNMHEEVKDMVERDRHFSKGLWKERVWARAWELEDVYWMVEFNLHQSLDLLHMVCYENRYLTWWAISDRYPQNISVCETLAKLVCHASLLKVDDVRLKGSSLASKFCTLCDLGQKEDVRHLVLQCPIFVLERESMFHDIRQLPNNLGINALRENEDALGILLGRAIDGYTIEQMEMIWLISGYYIDSMYRKNIRVKREKARLAPAALIAFSYLE